MVEPTTASSTALKFGVSHWVAAAVLLLLALVPLASAALAQPFYVTLVTRIMIFALAAMSLNLILGFGGLVSFGHAMYMGLGAYAVGVLAHHGVGNGWVQLLVALAVGSVVSLAVGAICLRTASGGGGMAFIMITLAFAQMLFFLAISLKDYGGDDGLPLKARSNFGLFNLDNAATLYYVCWVVLVLALLLFHRLLHARFGMVLRGCKSNERRMAALGFPTLRYKLVAYVVSALGCVVAGMLLANLTRFVAPAYMAWQVSGELIVMCVLGGLATMVGPIVGAAALLLLEELLTSLKFGLPWLDKLINQHWLALIGIFVVLVVLVLKQGLYGRLVARDPTRGDGR